MRFRTLVITVILGSLALLGCNKGNKLVGVWTFTGSGDGQNVSGEATFKADGSVLFEASNPAAPAMKIDMLGKYREDGDKLFVKFEDVQLINTPSEAKGQEQQMKDMLKKQIAVGEEKARSIAWTGDSAFTTTADKATMSFKKK